jgi:hypothetical protein
VATNQLHINGLEELKRALRALPAELVREADVIVQAQADEAMRQIAATYPVRSGAMLRGLHLETRGDQVSSWARVSNRTWYANVFEHGTKGPRHWATGKNTGEIRAADRFIPIAIYRRRIMESALVDLVRRAGFEVTV